MWLMIDLIKCLWYFWQDSEEVLSVSSELEKQLESFASKLLEDEVSIYLKRKKMWLCVSNENK